MGFKVGDRVRIKRNLREIPNFSYGYAKEMEAYEGNTVTIKEVQEQYVILEKTPFRWDKRAFEPIYTKLTKKELSNLPIGTKITTDKGKILVKDNTSKESYESLFESSEYALIISEINEDLTIHDRPLGSKIVKVEVPTYSTIYEYKEEKEMTLKEIEEQLGYKIKIKGE